MEKNEDVTLLKMDMKEAGEMTWKKELRMNLSMKAKASMLSWERCCSGEAALSQRVLRPQPLVTITTTEHDLETTAALQTD